MAERGLLNYFNGLINLPVDASDIRYFRRGDSIAVRYAESEEIEYSVKNANEYMEGDPIMNPNKKRDDGLLLVHNPNI